MRIAQTFVITMTVLIVCLPKFDPRDEVIVDG